MPNTYTRLASLLLTLPLANCAENPVTGNPNLTLLTESQEIAMGRREVTNVRRQYDVHDDAQVGAWPLRRFAEGHLRVINSMYPSGELAAGQALKEVE